jgi:murein DD-endopeptidase MepM/ murein hydrolase activator NlpD
MLQLRRPLLKKFTMTQNFDTKVSYMRSGIHSGIDWACPKGTELLACFDGVVIKTENVLINSGYGRAIWIRSKADPGFVALYGHASQILAKVGNEVKAGDIVALSGNTGFVLGAFGGYHLHFGLQLNGRWVDPIPYFDGNVTHVPVMDDKSYIVKLGDSLYSISQRIYGDGSKWQAIATKNNISNPKRLQVGQVLILP